jgi:hypothetical protein
MPLVSSGCGIEDWPGLILIRAGGQQWPPVFWKAPVLGKMSKNDVGANDPKHSPLNIQILIPKGVQFAHSLDVGCFRNQAAALLELT